MLSGVADGVPEGEEGWEDKKCVNQDRKGYPPYGEDIGMSSFIRNTRALVFLFMLLSTGYEGVPFPGRGEQGMGPSLEGCLWCVNRAPGEMADPKPPESICWDL